MKSHATSTRVHIRCVILTATALLLAAIPSISVDAQPTVEIGGLAYLDYNYVIASPDADEEGSNTFDFRRIYLTTDFTVSDDFSGRVRLEAKGTTTTESGSPVPFIKDAYLTWQDPIGDRSRFRLGVQSPPLFELSESTWGFRSLDATVMDRVKANSSRDLGFRADVPLVSGGAVRLAGMVANGNSNLPEEGDEGGKHLYAQVQAFPNDVLRLSVGTDYNVVDAQGDGRNGVFKTSVFAGGANESFHGGVEAFYQRTTFDDSVATGDPTSGIGVSVFGTVNVSERTSVVGRYDFVEANAGRAGADEHYGLAAFVYRPDPHVELMPNVVISKVDGVDTELIGRFTVHVKF